jgi:SAM-dependent methyltransferase
VRGYGPATYGERVAEVYDEWYHDSPDTAGTVDGLARLACGGPVLELGIGTGRIALPLAGRGLAVDGIDASEEMVARLRSKPGGAAIPVTIGDFADVAVAGTFSLVFAVFSTFFNLITQEEQLRCFRKVARRLRPGGVFVIEAFLLDPDRFRRGQGLAVDEIDVDGVVLEAAKIDLARQMLVAAADRRGRGRAADVSGGGPVRVAVRAGPDGQARRDAPARTRRELAR